MNLFSSCLETKTERIQMTIAMKSPAEKTESAKAVRTRARIVDAAIQMVMDEGYDKTTMRKIAKSAGTSVGNAYYYFPSKEHLVQGFYARTHEEHLASCAEFLENEPDFGARLLGVMQRKLATISAYHQFGGAMFKAAADPASPMNPFSDASTQTRDEATDLFRRVVNESDAKIPGELKDALPGLLWTYHMGVILYWIHDRSEGQTKSRLLVDQSVPLIVRLISLSRMPGLGGIRKQLASLFKSLGMSELNPESST